MMTRWLEGVITSGSRCLKGVMTRWLESVAESAHIGRANFEPRQGEHLVRVRVRVRVRGRVGR